MLEISIWIIGWIATSVIAYLALRYDEKSLDENWTLGKRWTTIFFSLLTGPLMFLVIACLVFLALILAIIRFLNINWEKEVKW